MQTNGLIRMKRSLSHRHRNYDILCLCKNKCILQVFFMFSGEKVLVDLRCDNSLMKTMVDRFGEDVITLEYDMTSFRVQTEVSASPTFFGWVFGFNGKVQILAPESVKEQYRQMIAQADEGMQQKENKEQEI